MLTVAGWLANAARIGRFPAQLLALTVGALPLTFLISFILGKLIPDETVDFFQQYLQVWGIGLAITLFMNRFLPPPITPVFPPEVARAPTEPPAPGLPRFLDRLPPALGPQLLCLSMEDHYVRAHGAGGSALILMRLRDALEELEGLPGLQVHRSWWVAKNAVERVERDGDRVRLRLVNGLAVPVARSQLGAVRAQGWPQG
jgi:hypothetical protein